MQTLGRLVLDFVWEECLLNSSHFLLSVVSFYTSVTDIDRIKRRSPNQKPAFASSTKSSLPFISTWQANLYVPLITVLTKGSCRFPTSRIRSNHSRFPYYSRSLLLPFRRSPDSRLHACLQYFSPLATRLCKSSRRRHGESRMGSPLPHRLAHQSPHPQT